MNKFVLADSCFWIALFDPNDQHFEQATLIADLIEGNTILIPWPTMYEFVNTRFMRRREGVAAFEAYRKRPSLELIDDTPYRNQALDDVFLTKRYSLVHAVIRQMLADDDLRTDYLATFNTKDFEDVCYRKQVGILSE